MKIKNYVEARKHYKVGDVVWACAYSCSNDKESKRFFQEPVKGQLTAANNQVRNDRMIDDANRTGRMVSPNYFVPFKKNGVDLAWSKAVSVSARMYADTHQESVELYNAEIDTYIDWCEKEIAELKLSKIC